MGVFTSLCSNNLSSAERMVVLHGDVPHKSNAEICFQGQVGGSLAQDLKCQDARVAGKAITSSRNARVWALSSPCSHCQQSLLMFPRLQLGAWNTRILEPSSSVRTETWNHCAVSALQPNCRPAPGITCQLVFQHDCWCLTESRETTLVLSASKNLGDSVLEPWVVRLEEQRKIVM